MLLGLLLTVNAMSIRSFELFLCMLMSVCFCHMHILIVRILFRQYTLYFARFDAFLLQA